MQKHGSLFNFQATLENLKLLIITDHKKLLLNLMEESINVELFHQDLI